MRRSRSTSASPETLTLHAATCVIVVDAATNATAGAGMIIGALLILVVEQHQGTLREQLLAEPAGAPDRIRLAFLISAALLSTPLLLFAVYCWTLGAKVRRAAAKVSTIFGSLAIA